MSLPLELAALAVVGAGPAGLCAALEAAKAGVAVVVLDENDRAGGQLFKQVHRFFGSRHHGAGKRGYEIAGDLAEECLRTGVEIRLSSTVLGFFPGGELMIDGPGGVYLIKPQAAVIATGASEKCMAFPGWTLPGIMGAGAAQTLVNVHGVLPGKRVLMAGAGNVGLIVSYQLLQAGAEVVGIIEISERASGYEVHFDRVRREGVPMYPRHRVLAAEGENGVEAVLVEDIRGEAVRRFEVDSLCMALGLTPLAELAAMRGCRMVFRAELGGFLPWHDEEMRTGLPGVYVAGDTAGIEEASVAMEEGRMSGISVAEDLKSLSSRQAAARKAAVRQRLEALRGGPYGEARLAAKNSLYCA
jgi:thioredoxin reductase